MSCWDINVFWLITWAFLSASWEQDFLKHDILKVFVWVASSINNHFPCFDFWRILEMWNPEILDRNWHVE